MRPRMPTTLRRRLTTNRKGALTILGGSAGGQMLALLAAPALSRLYTPADFGAFTVLSSLILTLATVAALRFDFAVPLPKRDRDAYGLVALALCSVLTTTVLGFAAVLLFGDAFARRFDHPELVGWLWLVPLTAATMGIFLVLNQLAIRHQRYRAIGRRNILYQTVTVTTQLAAGAAQTGPGGLILGLASGQSAGAVSLLWRSGLCSEEAREGRRASHLRAMAARYRRFPLLLAPSGLLNTVGLQLPVIFIALWYGSSVAGWLGLTQRILALPVTLLGTAIAQVYLGELSLRAHHSPERALSLFRSTSQKLAVASLIVALPLFLLGPLTFSAVFGSVWLNSGKYAQALAVSLAAQLVAAPLSHTLTVFERQVTQLMWDSARLVLTCSAVLACVATGQSPLVAIWAFSLASAVAYVGSLLLSWRTVQSRATERDPDTDGRT